MTQGTTYFPEYHFSTTKRRKITTNQFLLNSTYKKNAKIIFTMTPIEVFRNIRFYTSIVSEPSEVEKKTFSDRQNARYRRSIWTSHCKPTMTNREKSSFQDAKMTKIKVQESDDHLRVGIFESVNSL